MTQHHFGNLSETHPIGRSNYSHKTHTRLKSAAWSKTNSLQGKIPHFQLNSEKFPSKAKDHCKLVLVHFPFSLPHRTQPLISPFVHVAGMLQKLRDQPL